MDRAAFSTFLKVIFCQTDLTCPDYTENKEMWRAAITILPRKSFASSCSMSILTGLLLLVLIWNKSQIIIKPGCKSNVHFSLHPPTFWGSTWCVSHLFIADVKGKTAAEYPHGLCTYAGVPSGPGTRRAAWWCALQSLINQWLRQKGLQGLAPGTLEVWHYSSLENILTL